MTNSAKIILLLMLAVFSNLSIAKSQKVYDLGLGRELTHVDSIPPSHYQSYGDYLFFVSLNNTINLPWSERPAHNNEAIWRLDTRDNSTLQIASNFSFETDDSNGLYQVLNNKVMYFSTDGFTITNLNGLETLVLSELKDILVMNESNKLISFNGFVYFSARDTRTNKVSLWRSNGTAGDTKEVKLCAQALCYESPRDMVISGEKLYLISSAPNGQLALWSVDSQNNANVFTVAVPSTANGDKLIPYLNGVQFNADNGLWYSDGTSAGSYVIKYLKNQRPLIASETVNYGSDVIVASDELYVVSNHGKGTSTLIDIDPRAVNGNPYDSRPNNLTKFNNAIYFMASFYDSASNSRESKLMSYDGSLTVKEVYTFESANEFDYKIVGTKGNKLLLLRYATSDRVTNTFTNELWVSDGTKVGTSKISDISVPHSFWQLNAWNFVNNDFYFSAITQQQGVELWRTDATEAGTVLVKDLGYGVPRVQWGNILEDGKNLFYQIEHLWDGTLNGLSGNQRTVELWKTDATTMRSTKVSQWPDSNYSQPPPMISLSNGQYWWVTNQNDHSTQDLIFYNKQSETVTTLLSKIPSLCVNYDWQRRVFFIVGEKYFFQAPVVVGENYSCQLWVSDGTVKGTKALTNFSNISMQPENIGNLAMFNGEVYFSLNMVSEQYLDLRSAVYKTDGTPEGTKEVFRLSTAGEDKRFYIDELIATANGIFVVASFDVQHLWYWNSSALTQLQSFTDSNRAYDFVRFGQGLAYISAHAIYHSDGTKEGTEFLLTLNQSLSAPFEQERLTSTPDFQHLLYTVKDNDQIRLWRSDSTVAGTFPLGDVLDEYDFILHAQVADDLYIGSYSEVTGRYSTELLIRYSLTEPGSEVVYSQQVGDRNTPLTVVETLGRVFISGQPKLPGFGGPYVTARLDDSDMDQDGVLNKDDAFPLHSDEQLDYDADGLGDNADLDDDSDEVPDVLDLFPRNALEWADYDLDGTGNNADNDDDNDGVTDWFDSYPRDQSRSSNITVVTPSDPTPLPVPTNPTPTNASSGGAIDYRGSVLFLVLVWLRRQTFRRKSNRGNYNDQANRTLPTAKALQ